jgi:hypothetical protein
VRGRKEAAIKHALSLLPGPDVFLEAATSPRSYRVQAQKQTCVCPHVEEVHARKWKLYTPTQGVVVDRAATVIGTVHLRVQKSISPVYRLKYLIIWGALTKNLPNVYSRLSRAAGCAITAYSFELLYSIVMKDTHWKVV